MYGIMPMIVPPLTVPVVRTTIGSLPVGTIIKTRVNGQLRDFIIVNQGRPSPLYDTSCDGTWLLMKDIYEERQWNDSDDNDYENSTVNYYLNNSFFNLLDTTTRRLIKQVRIPYRFGSGYKTTPINSGVNGLACKVFLLSGYEVGWTNSTSSYFPIDGSVLRYFRGINLTDEKRIAFLNGQPINWALRSPYCDRDYGYSSIFVVYFTGGWTWRNCSKTEGIRPAFVMQKTTLVDENNIIIG